MKNRLKKLFNFKNQAYIEQLIKIPYNFAVKHDYDKKITTLTLYGIIDSDDWWDDSISAAAIDKALKEANGNNLKLHINSPGGDAFEGVAIYNRLMDYKKEHNAKIETHVDGWACSAASFLPLTANESIMGLGAMMMIHEAATFEWGTKKDLRKTADMMEKLEEGIIDIYLTRTKKSREEIREMVDAETWFTADEAIEIGFADKKTEVKLVEPESKPAEPDNKTELKELRTQVKNLTAEVETLKEKQKEPAKNSRAFLFY